jgi:hypothetical protein
MQHIEDAVRLAVERLHHAPVTSHACGDAAETATRAWALRFGLVDGDGARLARIRCGSFAAHTYPRASAELVELGANLIAWLFLFDDRYGEGHELAEMVEQFERCEAVLRDGETADEPFPRALADLRARCVRLGAGPEWLSQFGESLGRYFHGCVLEYPYRTQRRPPTRATYRQLRCWSIGAYPVFDLIELSEGPASRPARFRLGELRYLGALLCAWVNDIHSHRKEQHDGDPLNLVTVLHKDGGLALEAAYHAAVDHYLADLDRFRAARDALLEAPEVTDVDRAVARGLSDWVHGNNAWTGTSGRY